MTKEIGVKQLTDTRARNITPADKPVLAGGVSGLYLFPSAARGQGKWILRFASPITFRRRDMGLGTYPEVGIAAARRAGFVARELIGGGTDPVALRKARLDDGLGKIVCPLQG